MGEELKKSMNCHNLYIDDKKFDNIKDFAVDATYKTADIDYTGLNLSNREFKCDFTIIDEKLNKHYHLMNNSKRWRIRKKNKKRYDERFLEMFGSILWID